MSCPLGAALVAIPLNFRIDEILLWWASFRLWITGRLLIHYTKKPTYLYRYSSLKYYFPILESLIGGKKGERERTLRFQPKNMAFFFILRTFFRFLWLDWVVFLLIRESKKVLYILFWSKRDTVRHVIRYLLKYQLLMTNLLIIINNNLLLTRYFEIIE